MRISAIAAIAEKSRALGKDNKLLWRISSDLKRVRELTMGHPIIMGRKTMEHIIATAGKALPGRTNIVISRDVNLHREGFVVVKSIAEAIEVAKKSPGSEEAFVFGGAQIYQLSLPQIQRLYLTVVQDDPQADAFFPDYSEFKTVVVKSEEMNDNGLKYYYLTLER